MLAVAEASAFSAPSLQRGPKKSPFPHIGRSARGPRFDEFFAWVMGASSGSELCGPDTATWLPYLLAREGEELWFDDQAGAWVVGVVRAGRAKAGMDLRGQILGL